MISTVSMWEKKVEDVTLDQLINCYLNPSVFQTELANYINKLLNDFSNPSSIEVGSSFGITTALLEKKFEKTILDYSDLTLQKAMNLFKKIKQNIITHCLDILGDCPRNLCGKYDLVFNSGVLEHFAFSERRHALKYMVELTKPGGYIIIGVPNHLSLPYRIGYLWLNFINQWPYPEEYKIASLQKEAEGIRNLMLMETKFFDYNSVYSFLPRVLRKIFKVSNNIIKYRGYLRTFVFVKVK